MILEKIDFRKAGADKGAGRTDDLFVCFDKKVIGCLTNVSSSTPEIKFQPENILGIVELLKSLSLATEYEKNADFKLRTQELLGSKILFEVNGKEACAVVHTSKEKSLTVKNEHLLAMIFKWLYLLKC